LRVFPDEGKDFPAVVTRDLVPQQAKRIGKNSAPGSVVCGRPQKHGKRAVSSDPELSCGCFIWMLPQRKRQLQARQIHAAGCGIGRLHRPRVALDVDRLLVLKQVVKGQAAMPVEMAAQPGSILASKRMIDTHPAYRARSNPHCYLRACVGSGQPALIEQRLNLRVLALDSGLNHQRLAIGG
jgi:hypothetical protein